MFGMIDARDGYGFDRHTLQRRMKERIIKMLLSNIGEINKQGSVQLLRIINKDTKV
jgi:hypothetical protein